jgi:hypothetical protein
MKIKINPSHVETKVGNNQTIYSMHFSTMTTNVIDSNNTNIINIISSSIQDSLDVMTIPNKLGHSNL